MLVQSSVNSYGAAAMAGFAAYMKIDGFNILPVSSISMAATTFVGQNYGAGRLDRVKRSVWVTLAIGVIYTLCTGAALLAGQDASLHLFTADGWTGTPKECDEGELAWIKKSELLKLRLWEGDKIFLRLLNTDEPFFSLKLKYEGDTLVLAQLNGAPLEVGR